MQDKSTKDGKLILAIHRPLTLKKHLESLMKQMPSFKCEKINQLNWVERKTSLGDYLRMDQSLNSTMEKNAFIAESTIKIIVRYIFIEIDNARS